MNGSIAKPCAEEYDRAAYAEWLYRFFNIEVSKVEEEYYKNIIGSLENRLKESEFWNTLQSAVYSADFDYEATHDDRLLVHRDERLAIDTKSYDSALLKSWRRNVLDHDAQWPNPPSRGWMTPTNWYSSMSDLIRTQVLVKYLDGVMDLRDLIVKTANEVGVGVKASAQAHDEGYYAFHIDVFVPLRFPFGMGTNEVPIEIQVSTQVKDVIQRLIHQLYEGRRTKPRDTGPWQWNFEDDAGFTTNYLGHILHYVEGTIMRLRHERGS